MEKSYQIKLATEQDYDHIWEYLKKFYFKDEPLMKCLGLGQTLDKDSFAFGDKEKKFFLVAFDGVCNVIGVCTVELIKREDPEVHLKSDNPLRQKLFDFIRYVDKMGDLFSRYPLVQQMLQIKKLSVHTSWRRKGVAKSMITKTREIANKLDVPLIRMECTSYYSAQLALEMNFKCVYRQKYEKYLEDGIQVFFPEHPHEEIGVYVYIMGSRENC